MRFETGRSSDPVLATHRVVSAKARGAAPTCRAMVSPTEVSSTAVVSSERKTVHATASAEKLSHSNHIRCRPSRAIAWPATSKTPARSLSSATAEIARRKAATGRARPSASVTTSSTLSAR